MGILPEVVSVLKGDISHFMNEMGKASSEMDKMVRKGATTGERFRAGLSTGMMAAGAAAAGVGTALLAVADPAEKAEASLKAALDSIGASYDAIKPKIEAAIHTGEGFGHNASQTQEALAKLTISFKDPQKALDELHRAEELAAMTHMSLTEAADALGKVHGGSTRFLKTFGINIKDNATLMADATKASKAHEAAVASLAKAQDALAQMQARDAGVKKLSVAQEQQLQKAREAVTLATQKAAATNAEMAKAQADAQGVTKDGEAIFDKLIDNYHGAEAQADTFGGRLDALRARVTDVAATVGQHLGPVLIALGPVLMTVSSAMTLLAGAEWATLGPILLVVAGVALLAAGFVLAYQHIKPFHDAVDAAAKVVLQFGEVVLKGVGTVLGWLQENWPLLVVIFLGPFGLILDIATGHTKQLGQIIGRGIRAILEFLKQELPKLPGQFWDMVRAIGDVVNHLPAMLTQVGWDAIQGLISGITHAIPHLLDAAHNVVGSFLDGVKKGLDSHSPSRKMIEIGLQASKGLEIGVGGGLPGVANVAQRSAQTVLSASTFARNSGQTDGIGAPVINVTVQGHVFNWNDTAEQLAEPIRSALLRRKMSTGNLGLA